MSSKWDDSKGGSPGDSMGMESSDHDESEACDTLAPLPDDLLIHPQESDSFLPSPLAQSDVQLSSSTPRRSSTAANTTAASRRRSVEASSGRPIFPARNATKQDLVHAQKVLEALRKEHGFETPDRGNLDDPSIMWKEGKPDYTISDLHYLVGKTKNHPAGSLEQFVENFIKTWEMEATHKEFYQWTTVDQYAYEVQANGGRVFSSDEASWVGNYNWLLSTCNKDLYDTSKESFESSHGKFRYAFPEGFPFEVLEVFSGPPKVTFSWRHWAVFSGEFEGHKGSGETINMTGFGVVTLNEDNKAKKIEIYFDPNGFLEVLRGKKECRDGIDRGMAVGEPIAGGIEALSSIMAAIDLEESETGLDGADRSTETTARTEDAGKSSSRRCPFSGT